MKKDKTTAIEQFAVRTLPKAVGMALTVGTLVCVASPASAALMLAGAWQDAALSIDGWGSVSNSGTLQADTPNGAEVLKAYLYASSVWSNSVYDVSLAGNLLTVGSGTILAPDVNPATTVRWDVTSIMKPLIEGTNGLQSFNISESSGNDGAVLVVVYKHSTTAGGTSFILDGELATTGDSTKVSFAEPYNSGDMIMSMGISYGFQPTGQVTLVDVTTSSSAKRRLTSCAGGQDDGESNNGALITVGGIGDSAENPDPDCSGNSGPYIDDELYNLALGNAVDPEPFIKPGDTWITLDTVNPTNDDNVFFLGFTSTFKIANVDDEDIDQGGGGGSVPEPGVLALLGIGLTGLAVRRRRTAV